MGSYNSRAQGRQVLSRGQKAGPASGMRASRVLYAAALAMIALLPVPALAQSATCTTGEEETVTFNYSNANWTDGNTTGGPTNVGTATGGQNTLSTAIAGGFHTPGTPDIATQGNKTGLELLVNRDNTTQFNTITLTFARAVTKFRFTVSDIDYANDGSNLFRDEIEVNAVDALGLPSTPTATTAGTATNVSGNVATAITNQALNCATNSANCDATFSFSTPVRIVTITYRNGSGISGNTTNQAIGINTLGFCNPTVGRIRTSKITTNVAGGAFSFGNTNLASALGNLTTTTPGVAVSNASVAISNLNNSVTITEAPATGFALASVVCTDANAAITGLNAANLATLAAGVATITAANHAPGSDITCLFTNNPQVDVTITKGNGVGSLLAGATTVYTIRVLNNGPVSVNGVILSDPAVTGLNKTAVACSGTPGICVTPPSIAQLQGGSFALPLLTSGQFYEITVTATVTATGL